MASIWSEDFLKDSISNLLLKKNTGSNPCSFKNVSADIILCYIKFITYVSLLLQESEIVFCVHINKYVHDNDHRDIQHLHHLLGSVSYHEDFFSKYLF